LTTSAFSAPRKTSRTVEIVGAVAANVKEDQRMTCKDITSAYGISNVTKHNIIRDDLRLIKERFFH
jgi:hypothetical protein